MGEKMDALEPFHRANGKPDPGNGRYAEPDRKSPGRLRRAESGRNLKRKIKKNEFTLEDFLDEMNQVRKMGGIENS